MIDEVEQYDRDFHGITRNNPIPDPCSTWLFNPEWEDYEPDCDDEDDDGY